MKYSFSLSYPEAMKIVKKLAHSISKEQARYYLNGFYVHGNKAEGCFAVSTDGHRMTRIRIHPIYDGDFPSVIFPTAVIEQLASFKPSRLIRDAAIVEFDIEGLNYRIRCLESVHDGKLVDGNFPDYTRVIPGDYLSFTNNYGDVGFSSLYLAEIMAAAKYEALRFKNSPLPVRIFFQQEQPAVILESDPDVLYVLMPIRAKFPEHMARPETQADSAGAA